MIQANDIESNVVDPASIAVSRRRRRAKTDAIDGETLLRTLLAWKRGEPRVCEMVDHEGLYRSFANRRDVAAYAGLVPTPWRSGSIDREQGISKAGNPRLRHIMIELAWLWVRHQPDSVLSGWFRACVGNERGRIRRITIVALARGVLQTHTERSSI
jgi:transposase